MFNRKKNRKFLALTLLASLLLLAALYFNILSVKAQGQATVNVLASIGGTTDPTPGTYNYSDGTTVTFIATPDRDYDFSNWIISTTIGASTSDLNTPTTITFSGGTTYAVQAVFQTIQAFPGLPSTFQPTTDAIVGVLAAAGGTTNPPPGIYHLANATQFNLNAIPDSGWQFSHWVISGPNLSHGGYPYTATPTDNPYNVNHGYGNTFNYQPVFTPTGTGPTPTPTGGATATPTGTIGGLTMDSAIIIGLVVVIIVILIAFGVYASRRRK